MDIPASHRVSRVRVRAIVLQNFALTPRMRRLVLGGPDLAAWLASDGVHAPAAWVKLFPPGREGRAYTISSVDDQANTLSLDCVLHGDGHDHGTVSDWVRRAQGGEQVELSGPRNGGFYLLPDARWLWLGADASALPAAQSILGSLPSGIEVHAMLQVHDDAERQPLDSTAQLNVVWHRSPAVADFAGRPPLPMRQRCGPGQVWLAGEAFWVKNWKNYWLEQEGLERHRLSAKGYWQIGERDHRS